MMKRILAVGLVTPLTLTLAFAQSPTWPDRIARSMAEHGLITASEPETTEVEFSHTPTGEVDMVYLTGSFASWGATAIAMSDDDGDGTWTKTIGLTPGQHLYKFVEGGENWVWDENNPNRVDDGHQGFNSVLMITGVEVDDFSEGAHDGHVNGDFLVHSPGQREFFERTGENSVQINLWTQRGDVEAVDVIFGTDGVKMVGMDWTHTGDLFDHWRADIDDVDPTQPFPLLFTVRDGDETIALGVDGATDDTDGGTALPFVVDVASHMNRAVPEWSMDAIWYQIFPERFRNGDASNDHPEALPWTWSWHEKAGPNEERFYVGVFERNFGGDLQGIQWSLDYLDDLGINALYLNPVFESVSLHKYDTWDYRHIDDNFGVRGDLVNITDLSDPDTWSITPSDQVFFDLIDDVHERGMKIIIDGVFNHSGHGHWAFLSAQDQGEGSPYASWYKINSWDPFEYEGWAGEQDLPEFRQTEDGLDPAVEEHLAHVTHRWMDPNGDGDPSDGIDGWRLDVPSLIAKPFWERWNEIVRGDNPDAYTVGELWGRDPGWTTPDLFDAHMNYEWLRGVYGFFVHEEGATTPTELNAYMFNLHSAYDYRTNFVQQNLLGSHDTDRISSALINPNREVDKQNRVQDEDGTNYDQSKPGPEAYQRLRLIFLYQFTSVGAPMIWYGDEVGMWGADDPECRKPMLWADLMPYDNPEAVIDEGLHDWVRTLAHLRTEHEALRRGHLRPALLDDAQSVYAYTRRLHGNPSSEDVVVAIHRGEGAVSVEVPVDWANGSAIQDALTGDTFTVEDGKVALTLGTDEGAVLVTLN